VLKRCYRDSLAIREKLTNQDSGNADWQRDLSVSYNRVGGVLNAQGDLAGALKSYRDSLAIREKLANQDPSNVEWRDDLEASCCLVATALLRIQNPKRANSSNEHGISCKIWKSAKV